MLPIHHHDDVMNHIVRVSPLERVRLVPSDSDDRCARSQGCSSVLLEECVLNQESGHGGGGFGLSSERVQLSQDCADVIDSCEPSVTSLRSARRTFKFSFNFSHCF